MPKELLGIRSDGGDDSGDGCCRDERLETEG